MHTYFKIQQGIYAKFRARKLKKRLGMQWAGHTLYIKYLHNKYTVMYWYALKGVVLSIWAWLCRRPK